LNVQKPHELIAQIEAAFADACAPAADNISQPTYDDEGTSAYFRGKTWRGHSAKQLRSLDFSLTVMTQEAFTYFLPAFMIADIQSPIEADTIPESLLYHLTPDDSFFPRQAQSIISCLTHAQRAAVAAYFRYARMRDGEVTPGEYDGALKALASADDN
jgi:hypothetical protein